MTQQTAIIIGAGPAGLTAAYELLTKTDIKPVVYEASGDLGGLAKTVNYKGNRIDIGGHRFFSKSDRVMQWWLEMLPLQAMPVTNQLNGTPRSAEINYQRQSRQIDWPANGPDPETTDRVMLMRSRLSRILYLRRFFSYPVSLSFDTLSKLGIIRVMKIGLSYLRARWQPIKPERSLEDFFINRFGRELYLTFFKSYTEKVWGTPCREIKPEWGAQRVKGLSISRALWHALKQIFSTDQSIAQRETETSLIERFLYPKFGPGQMWEETARRITAAGGEIYFHRRVTKIMREGQRITAIELTDDRTGETEICHGDYFFSSMPVRELIACFEPVAPDEVRQVSRGLVYRDFITVGLLLRRWQVNPREPAAGREMRDNWIYIQEPDVKVGRLQIFNNWSPYLVKDPKTVWVGLEYFCQQGDELWQQADEELARLASGEMAKLGLIDEADVLDHTVIRVPQTYPAYTGSYEQFDVIRRFTDQFENLFLVGRNGMHRYNNQDHSMLTAMTAVENIIHGVTAKDNIWSVNTEQEYHETKIQ